MCHFSRKRLTFQVFIFPSDSTRTVSPREREGGNSQPDLWLATTRKSLKNKCLPMLTEHYPQLGHTVAY